MGDEVIRREGLTYICEVPKGMVVKKLEVKNGRVIARMENGQTMILHRSNCPFAHGVT